MFNERWLNSLSEGGSLAVAEIIIKRGSNSYIQHHWPMCIINKYLRCVWRLIYCKYTYYNGLHFEWGIVSF